MNELKVFVLSALLLCLGMGARADNTVTINGGNGEPDEEVTVSVSLTNDDAVSALQLSIPLDENLTFVNGSEVASSRLSGMELSAGVKDGVLNIVAYSASMVTISGTSGELLTFKLKMGDMPTTIALAPSKTTLTSANGSTLSVKSRQGMVSIRCAKAHYSTMTVDFGRVPIRSTYKEAITVTNVGNELLTISSLTFSDPTLFSSTTAFPLTVAAGSSAQLNVTYVPTERGTVTKSVMVNCNSVSRLNTIQLNAQPFAVNELHIGNASGISDSEVDINLTMNNMDDIIGFQVDFGLPDELEYVDGSFKLNDDRKQDHTAITSIDGKLLRIVGYSGSGKAFKGNDGVLGTFRLKLVGRNSVTLRPSSAILSAIIDGVTTNVLSADYGGRVTISSPRLSTSDALAFGDVPVTDDVEKTLTIRNNGSAPLTISRIVFGNEDFSIKESLPLEIPAAQSSSITVCNSDKNEGEFSTTMQIYSNDPDMRMKNVNVTGRVFAPNYLTVTADNIEPTDDVTLRIGLNNYDELDGIQFDIASDEVYSLKEENVNQTTRGEHLTLATSRIDEATLRVVLYQLDGNISPGEGDLLLLKLSHEDTMKEGLHQLIVKNIILGTKNMVDKHAGKDIISITFHVAKEVQITAKSYTRRYGEANPAFEYEVSGAELDGNPEITCTATQKSPVGTYPITVKKGGVKNYNDTYVDGVLTVLPSPLTITAKSYTRKQGEANPTLEVIYDGLKNGETAAVLTNQPVVACEALPTSEIGDYNITVSGAEADNYDIKYVAGKLTVIEADPVTVTAKSYSRMYGEANPTYEYEVSGAKLDGEPVITCEATAASPVGEYDIVVSKGTVKNYNDKYVAGKLIITKAPLTITTKSFTRKQGEENPAFEVSYEGWKNGETAEVLTKLPTVTCEATEASEPGEYAITVSGAEAGNYDIKYVAGKLTVIEADPVTVTAKSYSRMYGEANPTYEYEVSGAKLDGEPVITCEATAASPVGEYDIIVSKGTVKNYNDKYVAGKLTITKAPLSITAKSYTRKQGETNPNFEVSYEGWKNGETETVLTKQATVTCEATAESEPGEYDITVSGAEAGNYDIKFVAGKLTVTEADPVTVTAKSYSRMYGETNPTFEYEVSGAQLDGEPLIACEATEKSPVGTYPITIKKGGVKNYNDMYVDGVLTITPAKLTVTAGSYTKKQYDPMPEFAINYAGFVNGETETVLMKLPTVSCEADEESKAGEYAITVNGAEAGNYEISYVAGKLTVTEPDSYKLTYVVDGVVYKEYTVKYREPIVAEPQPVKPDYTFSGWSEIPGTMPAENVTVTGTFTLTGIGDAPQTGRYTVRIYTIGGKPLKELQRGVNIVVMSDGTKQKVVVK